MIEHHIPFGFAQGHGVFLENGSQGVVLYHRADTKADILQEVRRMLEKEPALHVLPPDDFEKRLEDSYSDRATNSLSGVAEVESSMGLDEIAAAMSEPEDLLKNEDDAPVIKMLNAIFFEAIRDKASDIHVEPYEKELYVRFRIDGILKTVLSLSPKLCPLLISRIKVLARLDIAEKRTPQDGRITLRLGGRAVDLRVSTLPSSHGERAVLRILDKSTEQLTLNRLGMSSLAQQRFIQMVKRPHGIILVTGPTGSGKSTTLYAGLAELDRKQRNVMTIEDPVEYNIHGVSQTQVNLKAGMTFARGLRAILRQDPDVVLIGEIRDRETADIAVQASLTGHLVLSTLHTNTATGAITRLCDMGVEPFLLTATLQGVLAQRLVRKLCSHCREGYTPDRAELASLGFNAELLPENAELFRAKGCEQCFHTGYKGRFGLFDLVAFDGDLRKLIHKGETAMEEHLRKLQPGLREVGFNHVLQGDTSCEEVLAVTIS